MGTILLQGGAEFGGRMADSDLQAIELAGGFDAPIRIIPAAAAPDNNHERAGKNGVRWFKSLGATNVVSLPLVDRDSADAPDVIIVLKQSSLVYLLGGFPHHLGRSLAGSLAWKAILDMLDKGGVIAGSSAGAMVMCSHYYDPQANRVVEGLGLLPNACILPHHDTFGQNWAARLQQKLPDTLLIGIDEETGMLKAGDAGKWQVYGKGEVTLYTTNQVNRHRAGIEFTLPG